MFDFGSVLGGQSEENSIKNRIRNMIFFFDLDPISGGPGDPGAPKKSQKNDQDIQKLDFGARLGHIWF